MTLTDVKTSIDQYIGAMNIGTPSALRCPDWPSFCAFHQGQDAESNRFAPAFDTSFLSSGAYNIGFPDMFKPSSRLVKTQFGFKGRQAAYVLNACESLWILNPEYELKWNQWLVYRGPEVIISDVFSLPQMTATR
jgi:hypothetical protein